ncbi:MULTISPECIES: MucR family transcriptional regulator [unclassified Mesorhizobium]|uniref:MucR family transcriptional regulator n=1 Tax=unclassified Mesorhizobium TaxID=325217 RepID=UPI003339A71E
MNDEIGDRSAELIELMADIVAAFVSNNSVPVAGIPELIASVHSSLTGLASGSTAAPVETKAPAVNPKKSVHADHIVCLEDGMKFKSLRRHLATSHNLMPDAYRTKWNLPSDYPMVAPSYAAQRSALAKESGLGRKAAAPAKRKAKG